ncbi:odorant receptor 30a-like [Zerene cesonia]|uniref:odorant receptor 30a-like n=1 Tax=Zerene cesonia TaxID=33412 RepID=UPI0018E590F9|nr:odorant receptor 30a-like [Zerene cesonia]
MGLFRCLKEGFLDTKSRLYGNRVDNLIWLVNVVPKLAGFSLYKDKIFAPFWIVHLSLLFYVYGVGSVVYQAKYAEGAGDFIKSYVNISILALTVNNSYWFIMKRPLLKTVLKQVNENDTLTRETLCLTKKYEKLLSVVKIIVFIFYGFNLVDAFFIYLPHRVDVTNDYYSMTPCVGLEPLTASPNREVCLTILCAQEFCIMTVVLNYQALLLFLIAHTAVMYQMLSEEMYLMDIPEYDQSHNDLVKQKLPGLVARHALTVDITNNLKSLYSVPLGVNFGSNAVCISLFFYLPLQEWVKFAPILIYCFLVFFLYCYLGQKLINASESFERSVYACGWEKFDLKEKKIVYVLLLEAQKPIQLLAADIIPVNIYTFATTLQAMFKFVTVVKF